MNKVSKTTNASGDVMTPFQFLNVCDLPDIYTHICFTVFKDVVVKNPDALLPILEKMSFINIKSEAIAFEFCNTLMSKNIKDFEVFIERSFKNASIARQTSIFRYDPKSILFAFLRHDSYEQANGFMRYVLHSVHLPDMEKFLSIYLDASHEEREEMVPKTIYSWYFIE